MDRYFNKVWYELSRIGNQMEPEQMGILGLLIVAFGLFCLRGMRNG